MSESSAWNTMTHAQVRLAHPHHGQVTIMTHPARYKVVACGRRFGKTTLALIAIMEAALRGQQAWWLAPTYQMASQVWRDLKAAMTDATAITISETERRIDLHETGGMIAIRSAHNPDNLRGAGLDLAVLDEAAFMQPRVWPEVVRPMLLERRGAALFLSTPFGKNWFWDVYQLGMQPDDPIWQSFHFSSWDNPHVPAEEIDAIRRNTSERVFREEYMAEFIEDAGQVFRGIREASIAPQDATHQAGHRYIMGVDWARDGDYTCLVVLDATLRQMVALDRFNKIGWDMQVGRLQALAERWQVAVIWAEANSIGAPLIERLQNMGLPVRPFMTTRRSKGPLIEALSLAIERGELALLAHQVLQNELASYTIERLPGGGYRYSAPPGLHDDTVIATALAWYGTQRGGLRVDFA